MVTRNNGVNTIIRGGVLGDLAHLVMEVGSKVRVAEDGRTDEEETLLTLLTKDIREIPRLSYLFRQDRLVHFAVCVRLRVRSGA